MRSRLVDLYRLRRDLDRADQLANQQFALCERETALPALTCLGVRNDRIETAAIKAAFGDEAARRVMISSSKSMTGHMLGAAGAIESIVCALAIHNGVVPPTINYTTPDPDCDLDYVPNTARETKVEVCANNSLGFGGHNACAIFKKI